MPLRRTVVMNHRVFLAISCSALVLSGCGHSYASCTSMGASSLIIVEMDSIRAAYPGHRLTARACVRETCKTLRVDRSDYQIASLLRTDLRNR